MVGGNQKPFPSADFPPVRTLTCPLARARSRKPETRLRCSEEMSGPMFVFSSAMSPTWSDSTAGTSSDRNLS